MIEEKIKAFLQSRLPGGTTLELRHFQRHTEGWSWETFSFVAHWLDAGAPRKQGFVVRKQPNQAGLVGTYDTRGQFTVLRALGDTDVSAPRVFWYELNPELLGAPFFVMEKVEGTIPLPWAETTCGPFRDAAERTSVARQFVEQLAALHAVDWHAKHLDFLGVPEPGQGAARQEVARWEAQLARVELTPIPLLQRAILWLKDRPPVSHRTSNVHGDYRLGNFICREGRIVAILDWELVHLGDPIEDLGWICLRPWRGRSTFMASLMERHALYRVYEECSGIPISEDHVRYYEVLGNLKLAVIHLTAARVFEDAKNADLRFATMGHHYVFMLKHIAELLEL